MDSHAYKPAFTLQSGLYVAIVFSQNIDGQQQASTLNLRCTVSTLNRGGGQCATPEAFRRKFYRYHWEPRQATERSSEDRALY